jgi:hypothetical protein
MGSRALAWSSVLAILALAVGLALHVPAAAVARADRSDTDLETGIAQVREGEFHAALLTLDGAVKRLSGEKGHERELARAHSYLAVAYIGLAQQEKAKAELLAACRADESLTLSQTEFPPAIIRLFAEARKETRGKRSKLPFILGGVAVAGGGAAVALGGGGGTPLPTPTPCPTTATSVTLVSATPPPGSRISLAGCSQCCTPCVDVLFRFRVNLDMSAIPQGSDVVMVAQLVAHSGGWNPITSGSLRLSAVCGPQEVAVRQLSINGQNNCKDSSTFSTNLISAEVICHAAGGQSGVTIHREEIQAPYTFTDCTAS